ncbi:ionotropic receptor 75a-like [Euwallacea similis]|uniref:ionotropic receptor 75a-like n=1 Tax=Euwallacea similis TaxID=1736056 RepID=UPI00344C2A42
MNFSIIHQKHYISSVIETYGFWKNASGIRISHPDRDLAVARRRNFRQYPIKAGNVLFDDKNIIISNFDDIPETSDSFFKQDMPILFSLLQSINATLQLTVYDYHGYGVINKSTGKIIMDGMIGDLLSEKIDIASTMYLTPYRLNLFQPLSPIDFWSVKFFLKRPSLSYVRDIYILTLSQSVWIATGIMTLLFFFIIYLVLQWEARGEAEGQKENITRGSVRRITVSDTILLCFEALCQQGTLIEPLRFAGRLTVLLLFLLFMFIYVAYSAGILVLLRSTANINTLNALLESRYEVGGLNKTYIKHYFESPKSGILRTLYVKKIGSDSYMDAHHGLERVQEGGFAFFAPIVVSYKYFLKNFTNYDVCALQEISGYMYMKSYPAVPKRSGYKEIFKVWLLRLQETGIAMRAKVRVVRKPQCNNQAGIFQSVRIFDCFYVLLIFVYGNLIAVCVLILERILIKYSGTKI